MRALLLIGMSLALAQNASAQPLYNVLGWTADSTSLVYKTGDDTGHQDEEGNSSGSAALAVVVDAQGNLQPYLLELSDATAEEKKRYHALPNRQAFDQWRAAHPLSCARGRQSPDGKARVDIKLSGKDFVGAWKGKAQKSRYVIDPKSDDDNPPAAEAFQAVFSVTREGTTWQPDSFSGRVAFYGTAQGSEVSMCWSPDGTRVAWIVHSDRTMRDPESNELRISTATATWDPEGKRTVVRQAMNLARRQNAKGMKAYRAKNYAAAMPLFHEAITADPSFVTGHYNLACVAALAGQKDVALAELKWLATSTDPEAKTKLKKAATDPDLQSLSGDPAVKALTGGSP